MSEEQAKKSFPNSEVIDLLFPLDNGTERLVMRRPKVRDQLVVDKSSAGIAEREVNLFANLCEVTPGDIGDLDMADYGELQEKYRGFLSSRQKKPAKVA